MDGSRRRVRRQLAECVLARSDHRTVVDDLAALLRPRYDLAVAVDGPGDGGVDLVLSKAGLTILVQVKHWRRPLGRKDVRDAVLKVCRNYVPEGPFEVWLVALGGFTPPARAFTYGVRLRLLETRRLVADNLEGLLPARVPRARHLRLRAMQVAGRNSHG